MPDTVEELKKKCNACNEVKSLGDFYIRKDTGSYRNRCKRCCVDGKGMERDATHKTCKHCGERKPFSEYQKAGGGKWLQPYCKPCDSKRKIKYEVDNIDQVKIRRRKYYESVKILVSPERKLASRIKCNQAISQAGREYNAKRKMSPEEKKAKIAEGSKRYRERNRDKILQRKREYNKVRGLQKKREWQARMMSNIHFRLTKNLRGRIYVALKRGIKSDTTMNLLGCSIEQFKSHIENQFTGGMTWGNMGQWHLDHKKPCSKFDLTKESEQRICFHFTNIQPLWWEDNLKKGANYQEQKAA